ncbi:glycosyltransferase family 39 protein [Candidatus Gottesmanbacteria bacterium]|nr:glycosyltransferase family 39 protein [Candidatus Gottesmanbacteria bacterium]
MKRLDLYVLIFLCALTAIIFGYFSLFYVDIHHDFIMFKPAVDAARGKMIFRDTFVQHGALTTIFQAAGVKLFGEYLAVIRLQTVFFYVATIAVLYLVWRKFLSVRQATVAVIFWIALAPFYTLMPFQPWSSVYSLFFQSVALLLFLKFCEKERLGYLLFTGIAAGLTFWSRTPVGVFLVGAIALFFPLLTVMGVIRWKKGLRFLLWLVLGVLIGIVPVLLWLANAGALRDWWLQSIVYGHEFAKVTRGTAFLQIIKSLAISRYWTKLYVYGIWLTIPLATLSIVVREGMTLLGRKQPLASLSVRLFGAGLILLASWMQYYPVTEEGHFFWAATPMIGFFLLIMLRQKMLRVALTILIIVFFFLRISLGLQKTQNAYIPLSYPKFLIGMKTTTEEADYLTQVSRILDQYFLEHPDKTYINLTADAYFSMINPHYRSFHLLYVNWPMAYPVYPDYEQAYKTYIQTYSPLLFTRTTPVPAGYCEIPLPQIMTPPIALYASCAGQ